MQSVGPCTAPEAVNLSQWLRLPREIPKVLKRCGYFAKLPVRQPIGKPLETTHFACRWRRQATLGFANVAQAARVNSLTIAAGGLQTRGRLSFKTGVFGAVEPPKAARHALWDKNKNSKPCHGCCERKQRSSSEALGRSALLHHADVDRMIGSRDFKRQNISLAKLPLRLRFADMPSGGFGTYPTAPPHIVFALESPRGAFALQLQHTAVPAFGLFA